MALLIDRPALTDKISISFQLYIGKTVCNVSVSSHGGEQLTSVDT